MLSRSIIIFCVQANLYHVIAIFLTDAHLFMLETKEKKKKLN